MHFSRRRFMQYAAASSAAAIGFEGFLREPGDVEFTEHRLDRQSNDGRAIRFAQLSDLHLGGVGAMHHEIAARIAGLGLDCLLITGDAIDGNHHLADLDEFLSLFKPGLPKFAVLGNWEHWGHVSRANPPIDFDSYGVRYLFAGHTHGGQVNLAGLTPFMPPGCGDYVKGWYRERMPAMYVVRGIGTSILPVRIGSLPEVAVFTW
jgi:predicted MPP superfamily phosphohydrolase